MAQILKVGIGGLGAIGMNVARRLDEGIYGLQLAAVSARDHAAAAAKIGSFATPVPVVTLSDLASLADVIVECVPADAYVEIARPAIAAGRTFITLSCGQLLNHPELIEQAKLSGARIIIPSGALLGLDAVSAAAEGQIHSVVLRTRKHPRSLAGAPYLQEHGIELDALEQARCIFKGTAREGARGFPANVNVAAALSLAGIGPDATELEIWADPAVNRNIHQITVEADSARFELKIENIPSEENPRTGKLTALSAIATLRGLAAPLRTGG